MIEQFVCRKHFRLIFRSSGARLPVVIPLLACHPALGALFAVVKAVASRISVTPPGRRASSLLSSLAAESPPFVFRAVQKITNIRFVSGATTRRSDMAVNRIALIGLSVLVLSATTTVLLAQNTSNPLRSGNTVNPILSGNTVAAGREAPVSPAPSIPSLSTGTNPFTGQPCSGPPTTGGTTTSAGAAFPSVYGPPPSSC